MLEWNAFIKPVVYVVELIFAAVVTIGTADKLLFRDSSDTKIRCVFDDSIGACSAVISVGTLCMIGGLYVLWKRLSSAFLCDMKYRNDTESVMCLLLSIGWLSVASIITHFRTVPPGLDDTFLHAERRVTITFAWLLWVFHIGSVAIAWFAPDEDDAEKEPFHPDIRIDADQLPLHPDFDYAIPQEDLPLGLDGWAAPTPEEMHAELEGQEGLNIPTLVTSRPPATPDDIVLSRFLSQHDDLEPLDAARPQSHFPETPGSFIDERPDELRPRESIQDLASVWKDIVSADIEAETPEMEITLEPETPAADASGAGSSQQPALQTRPTLRRRTVRFDSNDLIGK